MVHIRRIVVIVYLVGLVAALALAAPDRARAQVTLEDQLVARFGPIAMLRKQTSACDHEGEGYFPAPVETVLGNPEVALKEATSKNSTTDPIVTMGPTAQDLAGKDARYYLDFPGDPTKAGCHYESDFKRFAAAQNAQPTTYAHLVVDTEHDRIALQYWFWYYFNDWNNTHESDWEMVQLLFATGSVAEALTSDPVSAGFAQHGGGETADWTDSKLQREGDHILIYPAAGSHGTYFGSETYIGWGEHGTGFGCDNTTSPFVRTPLTAVRVPNDPDPDGPFAWLLFTGRWGERQSWEFNGPFGPNTGVKWRDPWAASEAWRTSSLRVPGSRTFGPKATDLFCDLSASGSRLVTRFFHELWLLAGAFAALLMAFVALILMKRRELREAFLTYRRHARVFIGIGAFTIPIGIVYNGIAILATEQPPFDWLVRWLNDTAAARLTAVALIGSVQQLSMVLLIAPPVIQALKDGLEGREPSVRRAFIEGYREVWSLLRALVLATAVLALAGGFVIGLPVAIWLSVRWQFFGQATILGGHDAAMRALGASSRAVSGRWWRALADAVVFQLIAIVPGPLVGVTLMLMGKTSVDFANASSSLIYALTIPASVIGLTLAYLRYHAAPLPPRPWWKRTTTTSI